MALLDLVNPRIGEILNRLLPLLALVGISLLGALYRAPQTTASAALDDGDIAWMLMSTALVLLMTPGLSFFYAGLVKQKNIVATIMHCFVTVGVVTVIWIIFGFSMIFGDTKGFWGNPATYFMLRYVGPDAHPEIAPHIPLLLFAFYQLMFAIISAAIVTGAFAERIQFKSCMLYSILYVILIYCPVAHWTNNPNGFMKKWGVVDFAGGLFVHCTAGFSGLATTFCVRRRVDRTKEPANVFFVFLGTSLLWFGWFGFNAGSALAADAVGAKAFAATHAAAATAMLTWNAFEAYFDGKPTAVGAAFGVVCGLVGITPCAGYVTVGASLAVGAITATGCYFMGKLMHRIDFFDDTLDVFACHGVGGVIGSLLVGVLTEHATPKLFAYQLLATLIACAWSGVVSFLILKGVGYITELTVSEEDEVLGLDAAFTGDKKKTIESIVILASYIETMDIEGARQWMADEASKEDSAMVKEAHEALSSILFNLERFRPYLPDALFASQDQQEGEPEPSALPSGSARSLVNDSRVMKVESIVQSDPSLTSSSHLSRNSTMSVKVDLGLQTRRVVLAYVQVISKDDSHLGNISSAFVSHLFETTGKSNGTVHTFNAISALVSWGAVSLMHDSAVPACRCLFGFVNQINKLLSSANYNARVVGALHVEKMAVGNIGTSKKRAFHIDTNSSTFVADLSRFNEQIGTSLLVTEQIRDLVSHSFKTRPVDFLAVSKVSGEEVFRTVCSLDEEYEIDSDEWMYQLKQAEENVSEEDKQYAEAFQQLLAGSYTNAMRGFTTLNQERMTKLAKSMADSGMTGTYRRQFGRPWQVFEGEADQLVANRYARASIARLPRKMTAAMGSSTNNLPRPMTSAASVRNDSIGDPHILAE